jgi:hypothetical protein
VAGKPIWAKDAKIEAGMKAFVGALLGAGLMWAARSWLKVPLPFSLGELGGANPSLGEALGSNGTLGGLAITSLATIAALLGGFYDADNTPGDDASDPKRIAAPAAGKRIAAPGGGDEVDEDLEAEAEKPRARK